MDPRHILGAQIEAQAATWFLAREGGTVLARNYRARVGEIDLIFEVGEELVFVEVRARAAGAWTSAVESVRGAKLMRLHRTIRRYLADYRGNAQTVRFDILGWNGTEWDHARNVWPLP